MESRRALHHRSNTIKPKHDKKHGEKIRSKKRHHIDDKVEIIESTDKVYARIDCVWCGLEFDDYSIRCRSCGNCQFCGMLCPDALGCRLCGNHMPDDFIPEPERTIKVFGKIRIERKIHHASNK